MSGNLTEKSGKIRVAVLGTGSIGMRHIGLMMSEPDAEVVAVPARPGRAAELRGNGIPAVADLCEAPPLDAAVIATDTSRHVDDIERCLKHGIKRILVEKPLAPSVGSIGGAVGAEWAGSRIFVAYCMRFDAGLLEFRRRLPEAGPVYEVRIEARSYLPLWRPDRDYRSSYSARRAEGGVLRDLSHEVDYAVWTFGAPRSVSGRIKRSGWLDIESEDQAMLSWTAPSGAEVFVSLDYLAKSPVRRMTAYGRDGSVTWDALEREVRVRSGGKGRDVRVGGARDDMYAAQTRAFLDFIKGADPAGLATFDEGGRSLAVCDAARLSSERGGLEEVLSWEPITAA